MKAGKPPYQQILLSMITCWFQCGQTSTVAMKQLINFYQSNMEECFFVLLYKLATLSFMICMRPCSTTLSIQCYAQDFNQLMVCPTNEAAKKEECVGNIQGNYIIVKSLFLFAWANTYGYLYDPYLGQVLAIWQVLDLWIWVSCVWLPVQIWVSVLWVCIPTDTDLDHPQVHLCSAIGHFWHIQVQFNFGDSTWTG